MLKILLSDAEDHNNKLRRWNVSYTLFSEEIAYYQSQQASQLLEELINNFMLCNSLYYQQPPPRLTFVITELSSWQSRFAPQGLKNEIKDLVIETSLKEYERHTLNKISKNN